MKQVIRTITLLWSLALTLGEDTSVICIINEDCLLPCSSSLHDIIHWVKDLHAVHSFFSKKDQLEHQSEDYAKRTSLFPDLIPKGNISLLLKQVKIKDSGRYKCYTADHSNNRETYVVLNVEAPIKQVDIKLTSDGLTCSTVEVYPKPDISWFINLIPQQLFKSETPENGQGLFSLTSTFTPPQIEFNITYSCTISIRDRNKSFRASLRKDQVEMYSRQDATIHCPVSQSNDGNDVITLSFGESSNILTYTNQVSQTPHKKIQWKDIEVQATHEGTIILHSMEVNKHNGIYICERTTTTSREFVQTLVEIKPDKCLHSQWWIPVILITVVAIIAATVIGIILKKRGCSRSQNTKKGKDAMVKVPITESEDPPEGISLTASSPNEHT